MWFCITGVLMPKFNVKFQRAEYYVENMEIEADSSDLAEIEANRLLENGEISFDGEVCHGDELVLEIIEWIDESA